MPEQGRLLVREEIRRGGTALPWADRVAFRDSLFARSLAAFDAGPSGDCLFDRSFVDCLGYSDAVGASVPEGWAAAVAARRFADPVLVCPPWPEIFANDSERKHDFAAALSEHAATVAAYRALGYRLVEVPRLSVAERTAFVLATLGLDRPLV